MNQNQKTTPTAIELLQEIADELHWQHKTLARVRSEVICIAWFVVLLFLLVLPGVLVTGLLFVSAIF